MTIPEKNPLHNLAPQLPIGQHFPVKSVVWGHEWVGHKRQKKLIPEIPPPNCEILLQSDERKNCEKGYDEVEDIFLSDVW